MEVGMRRNPKAELQRHRRWTQHRRGWPQYPFRGSYYRHMQKHLNRSERHQARIDLRMGPGTLPVAAEEPREVGGLLERGKLSYAASNVRGCQHVSSGSIAR